MITNKGKDIIGKYLLGQAPAYASYIAVGCGAKPLEPYVSGAIPDYSAKQTLDFEMFRIPISSRGFIDDDGVSKIVLTGELPTEERYEITEVGIFSAKSNSLAGTTDSKNLYAFTTNENWKINGASSVVAIPERLDSEIFPNIIRDSFSGVARDIFQTNADNQIFTFDNRESRHERSRFLNNMIILRGNSSVISSSSPIWTATGNFIQLSSTSADLSKNSLDDELRFAFSILSKDGTVSAVPNYMNVKIIIEFSSSTSPGVTSKMQINLDHNNTAGSLNNFNTNRYFVVNKKIEDLKTSSGFPWKAVDTVKVYAEIKSGASSANAADDDYYVALDALRLENTTSENALYGLTGYSVIRNLAGMPIVKNGNTSNYIEFRFAMDVS
jgi:hypothetical protein